jgi:hypothetical protein
VIGEFECCASSRSDVCHQGGAFGGGGGADGGTTTSLASTPTHRQVSISLGEETHLLLLCLCLCFDLVGEDVVAVAS